MRKRSRGFSLVEIVVVLAIVAVMLAVLIPAVHRYKANQDLKGTVDQVVAAIQLARSNAAQYVDGVTFNNTTIPAVAQGEFVVFAVKQGSVIDSDVSRGYNTSVQFTLLGQHDQTNQDTFQQPVFPRPPVTNPPALPAMPFGSVVCLGAKHTQFHMIFEQNGTMRAPRAFNMSNGDMTYTVSVDMQGAVKVTQPDGQTPQ